MRRVAHLIDRVQRRINRRRAADGLVCPVKIVIDRARKSDRGDPIFFIKLRRAAVTAVAADNNQRVNLVLL